MASNTRWISYNDVNKHPEDSILLAYLRGQELEARSSVIQHIENEKCSVCLHKLNELKQISTTLEVLGAMRSYQYYPELSVADTFACMQNAVNRQTSTRTVTNKAYYQQRPRKPAMQLISVPVALGLAILFTMAMLVFANFSDRSFNPFSLAGGTISDQHMYTVVVPPHTTSTPQVNLKATATGTPGAKEPHMKVCSTRFDIAQMRMVICAFNFNSKHKATLVVYMPDKKSFSVRSIPVDKHGKFQVGWPIAGCNKVPTFIYAYEAISSKSIKVTLHITSFGSCSTPTIPVVKSSGFSPSFVR